MKHIYDVIVIGGGPAGYTAALYCARAGMDTAVIEKLSAGGQMCLTPQIDNYPGFDEGIDGFTLGDKMQKTAQKYGTTVINEEVIEVCLNDTIKVVKTAKDTLYAKTVVAATGAEHKALGIENEEKLVGKGVGYCATCDGMLYKNKTVSVVGGGNSAVSDALYLSKICKKVYLIHRRDTLRATKVYHEPLMKAENVELCWNSVVDELLFENKLKGIKIKDVNSGEEREILCDGLFISIGRKPETELFKNQLELDSSGYIIADENTKTNLQGVFAAGDVRTKSVRQIVTATADGAVAAHFAEEYTLSPHLCTVSKTKIPKLK